MSNLRDKLKEILKQARDEWFCIEPQRDLFETQADAIFAFWDEQKKGMRETIRLEVDEWVGNNLSTPMLESELDDIANQITASLVPMGDFRESVLWSEIALAHQENARLTKELEEARGEIARLEKQILPGVTQTDTEKEIWEMALGAVKELAALKQRAKFLPGDLVWVLDSYHEIRQVPIETLSAQGHVGLNFSGARTQLHQSKCFATADECRAAIPVRGLEERKK